MRDIYLMRTINGTHDEIQSLKKRELTFDKSTGDLLFLDEDDVLHRYNDVNKSREHIKDYIAPKPIWNGTELGFQFPNDTSPVKFTDLKGERGNQGKQGEGIEVFFNSNNQDMISRLAQELERQILIKVDLIKSLETLSRLKFEYKEDGLIISDIEGNLVMKLKDGKIYSNGFIKIT